MMGIRRILSGSLRPRNHSFLDSCAATALTYCDELLRCRLLPLALRRTALLTSMAVALKTPQREITVFEASLRLIDSAKAGESHTEDEAMWNHGVILPFISCLIEDTWWQVRTRESHHNTRRLYVLWKPRISHVYNTVYFKVCNYIRIQYGVCNL